jgi:hypothetical protein
MKTFVSLECKYIVYFLVVFRHKNLCGQASSSMLWLWIRIHNFLDWSDTDLSGLDPGAEQDLTFLPSKFVAQLLTSKWSLTLDYQYNSSLIMPKIFP